MADAAMAWEKSAPGPARLVAAGIAPEEVPAWLERFNALRAECGCVLGARFLVAAVLLYPAAWAILLRPHLSTAAALASWAGAALLAMGIGKAIGIAVARRRLRRLLAPLGGHGGPAAAGHTARRVFSGSNADG